jgi:hypothetical protein
MRNKRMVIAAGTLLPYYAAAYTKNNFTYRHYVRMAAGDAFLPGRGKNGCGFHLPRSAYHLFLIP